MKILTQEVTIIRYICPHCKIFLGKDLDKIDSVCPRCKTYIEKFDFDLPTPYHSITKGLDLF